MTETLTFNFGTSTKKELAMGMHSEDQYFHSFTKSNYESFEFFYKRYHQPVFANISKLVNDRICAQDLLQDVFVSLWENRNKIHHVENVPGWLFRTSYNKSIDFLKKRILVASNDMEEDVIDESQSELTLYREQHFQQKMAILNEAINKLPPRKKAVFKMCKMQGLSHEAVAENIGISETSVKDYLKQSSKLIRMYIRDKYPKDITILTFVLFVLNQGL